MPTGAAGQGYGSNYAEMSSPRVAPAKLSMLLPGSSPMPMSPPGSGLANFPVHMCPPGFVLANLPANLPVPMSPIGIVPAKFPSMPSPGASPMPVIQKSANIPVPMMRPPGFVPAKFPMRTSMPLGAPPPMSPVAALKSPGPSVVPAKCPIPRAQAAHIAALQPGSLGWVFLPRAPPERDDYGSP